jgi:hypothetical protein
MDPVEPSRLPIVDEKLSADYPRPTPLYLPIGSASRFPEEILKGRSNRKQRTVSEGDALQVVDR